MATKTIRENFVNTYGTDLLIAYFDPGADQKGAGRYNFASYSICNDDDWLKAIGALRSAACLFKLPVDASASVDIVLDTANPDFRTAFFVQIHRSSHLIDAACKPTQDANSQSDASKNAVEKVKQAISEALETLRNDPPVVSESNAAPPPRPTCSLTESCGGRNTTTCADPIDTVATCVQPAPGVYDIICVPRVPPT